MGEDVVCLICSQAIATADDYYRELDCSFPNCPGRGYHEDCIVRHLRKKGNGPEQKTGYPCPATLHNGKQCSGTIRKTHIRTPTNEKKKEQARQTAITAASINAAARSMPKLMPLPKRKPISNEKVTPLRAKVQSSTSEGIESNGSARATNKQLDDQPARQLHGTLADFFAILPKARPVQRPPQAKPDEGNGTASDGSQKPSFTWRTRLDDTNLPDTAPDTVPTAKLARAISKNSSMAPEPVSRQRIIPGWSGPVPSKPTKASLEQDRARAAALRAEIKGAAGARVNAAPATAATGSSQAVKAAADIALAEGGKPTPKTMSKPSEPPARDIHAEHQAQAQGTTFLADKDFPAILISSPNLNNNTSNLPSLKTSISAPTTPQAETEPFSASMDPLSPLDASPLAAANPPSANPEAETGDGEDPIVDHQLLFATEDNTHVVQDPYGNYVAVEELYGPVPELVYIEHEPGCYTYYVVVRQSHLPTLQAYAAAAAAQMAEASAGEGSGSLHGCEDGWVDTATVTNDGGAYPVDALGPRGDAALADMEAAAVPVPVMPDPIAAKAGGLSGTSAHAQEAVEDGDDDLDDLLALCLGVA